MKKNITISRRAFSLRLQSIREAQRLTRSELAQKAGVTYRTILNLESGKRDRIQEKTLLLLSEALQVDRVLLLKGDSYADGDSSQLRRRERQLQKPAIYLILASLLAASSLMLLWWTPSDFITVTYDSDTLKGIAFGFIPKWSTSHSMPISQCEVFDSEDGRIILCSLKQSNGKDSKLCAYRIADGSMVWEYSPDLKEISLIFGSELANSGAFLFKAILRGDLDGDHYDDAIVHLQHHKWYPSGVLWVEPDTGIKSSYYHSGHLYEFNFGDIDDDGKQEVIVGGTNNTETYRGGTMFILDDTHFSGAAVDPIGHAGISVEDQSFKRIVFPEFESRIMKLNSKHSRINVFDIAAQKGLDGRVSYIVNVGTLEFFVSVTMDATLTPTSVILTDQARSRIRFWPENDQRAFDLEYFGEWINKSYTFSSDSDPSH